MTRIIQIGNSQGVRIPKALIECANLQGSDLTLELVPEGILITPNKQVRKGWAAAFRAATLEKSHLEKDDIQLQTIKNKFDEEEWEW